jgi:hypothetical protein
MRKIVRAGVTLRGIRHSFTRDWGTARGGGIATQALQTLLEEMSSNAEERVNVQQALFEVESQNEANLWQIEQLEDQLQKSDQLSAGDRAKLHASYAETMEAVSANEESRMSLMEDLRSNEADRLSLQERLEMDSQRPQSRKHKVRVSVCMRASDTPYGLPRSAPARRALTLRLRVSRAAFDPLFETAEASRRSGTP